ncbi:MAG: DUF2279 domain-containing protein [Cyclobacteriaceae bacterium]
MSSKKIFPQHLLPVAVILFAFSFNHAVAQSRDSLKDKRIRLLVASAGVYAGGMTGLSLAWYKNEKQPFRWFNDLPEWKQMDKAGHFYTAYHLADIAGKKLKKTGMNPKAAAWAATITSILALSAIEIPDGYSPDYGASGTDIIANMLGSLSWMAQQNRNEGALLVPKFSFHRSGMAGSRPEILGKNFAEQVLKDYNGQTYWLSADMDQISNWPKWINIAVGYGASGMKYGRDEQNIADRLQPYRRWFLGLDIDLTNVPTRHKFLKKLFAITGYIRIPAPAIEFSSRGWTFHAIRI